MPTVVGVSTTIWNSWVHEGIDDMVLQHVTSGYGVFFRISLIALRCMRVSVRFRREVISLS